MTLSSLIAQIDPWNPDMPDTGTSIDTVMWGFLIVTLFMWTGFMLIVSQKRKPEPETHVLKLNSGWGGAIGWDHRESASTFSGERISVYGFMRDRRKLKKDDFVVLESNDGSTTRYRIEATSFPRDPADQFFLNCVFAPRQAKERDAVREVMGRIK